MKFFGLLYVSEAEKSSTNLRSKNSRERLAVYVNCAATLSQSLLLQGARFELLTNDAGYLRSASDTAMNINIKEIPFRTEVPEGIAFYSAHFKLDVFSYLAKLDTSYAVFVDIDMLCVRPMPIALLRNAEAGIPMCYDISDQVSTVYSARVISDDLERIHKRPSEGRWYGGEFLAGPPAFFKSLSENVAKVYGNYVRCHATLHHQGDEAITSAALELMRSQGVHIADAGTLGVVGRYWNRPVRHVQRNVRHYLEGFLLHLPADKRFLARAATAIGREHVSYLEMYRRHVLSLTNKALFALRLANLKIRASQLSSGVAK
jgi:hypothetical protein